MRVDFHVHSTFSDGTFTPQEIAAKAVSRRVKHFIITDHDNVDAKSRGIELAVDPGPGMDQFHLLGLGLDPESPALAAFLRRILDGRRERNLRIIGRFARLGIAIDPKEIARYAHGEVLARPHFAKYLVDHGHARSIAEAFEKHLMKTSPAATSCFEERYQPPPAEAIEVIHAAGGLALMAHPRYWSFAWRKTGVDFAEVERRLGPLIEQGLDGLEAVYGANSREMDLAFTRMADKFGLVKSAGSDFHGTNKPDIRLGIEVQEAFIAPLLERLGMA